MLNRISNMISAWLRTISLSSPQSLEVLMSFSAKYSSCNGNYFILVQRNGDLLDLIQSFAPKAQTTQMVSVMMTEKICSLFIRFIVFAMSQSSEPRSITSFLSQNLHLSLGFMMTQSTGSALIILYVVIIFLYHVFAYYFRLSNFKFLIIYLFCNYLIYYYVKVNIHNLTVISKSIVCKGKKYKTLDKEKTFFNNINPLTTIYQQVITINYRGKRVWMSLKIDMF